MNERPGLTKERIVDGAIALLDRDGYANFSMRKLAAYFDVDPMAVYYHVPNRAALVSCVVEAVLSTCELPAGRATWQDTVRAVCSGFRDLGHRHPRVMQVYDEYRGWVPSEHRISEVLHSALLSAGFPEDETAKSTRMLISFMENFTANELADWIGPFTPEMRSEFTDSLTQGDFPHTTQLLGYILDVKADEEFVFGLDVLIRGLESKLASGKPSPS